MKTMNSNTSHSVTSSDNTNNNVVKLRRIPTRKIALLKRKMDGAEKRMIRLESELAETRAIIHRKYTELKDEKEKVVGHKQLSPAQIKSYRLKRSQIDQALAIAKGDYFEAKREFEDAAGRNIAAVSKTTSEVKRENKTRREAKALLKKTKAILKAKGKNGGAKKLQLLTTFALADNIEGFRETFDESMEEFDPSHYVTISGVSSVKTEIIHEIMEEMVEEAIKNNGGSLDGAVDSQEGGAK